MSWNLGEIARTGFFPRIMPNEVENDYFVGVENSTSRSTRERDDRILLAIKIKEPLQELEGGGGGDAIGTGEDTSDEYRVGESVTPYAGTGLITISDAGRVQQNGDTGESVSSALETVTTRRADFACNGHLGGNGTEEWDPEVGRKQRKERDQWRRSMSMGACIYSSSCSHGSNVSESGSSDEVFTSGIACDSSRRSSRRDLYSNLRHSKTRAREVFRTTTRGSYDKYHTENARCRQTKSSESTIRSSTRTETSYDKERRAQTRVYHRTRRHRKVISGQKPDAANDNNMVTATLVGEMAGLGRQAMANAVRIAVRTVVDSWTGVASVARKAVRRWKLRCGLDRPILPIAANKSNLQRKLRLDAPHGAQDRSRHTERALFRSFLGKSTGPSFPFLSWGQSDVTVAESRESKLQGVHRGHSVVAELRESDHEVCYWVRDERTRGHGGNCNSPPHSWEKVVV
ncbi:unnamed protein product [Ascophyllum nodosum]